MFDAGGTLLHMDVGSPGILADNMGNPPERGLAQERIQPGFTSNLVRLLRLHDKGTMGADTDLVVYGEGASVRHFMAGGRWRVSDGEVMMPSTTRATNQEANV